MFRVIYFLVLIFITFSCTKDSENEFVKPANSLFSFLESDSTGINFQNVIRENDSIHVLDNYYIYNGGGVGIGDFDQNGSPDVFFAGNMNSSQLYLNQGNLKFRDITEVAGVQTSEWISGVAVVDLDGNGWDDIYLSSGVTCEYGCRNLLFMNQGLNAEGIPVFIEQGTEVGLADTTHVTQTVFFDYDLDGDLDAYILKNVVDGLNKNTIKKKGFFVEQSHTEDRLLKNNGIQNGKLSFTDVSIEAGVIYGGYGLGIAVSDFNQDGWPDLYIANDFAPNDLMYINQKDGTFKDMAPELTQHQSYNGMGCDIADINNDGFYDIMVMDMLPEDNKRQKTMLMGANQNQFQTRISAGYQPQFMRNTLQLGNGSINNSQTLPFNEVAQIAGVQKTDWSWAPIMTDFDNDGNRDIYISNGFVRDMTDLDFISNKKFALQFGTEASKFKKLKELYNQLDGAYLSNYMYANHGDLKFEDVTSKWGLENLSYSQGTAFSDLDGDGDLDIVVNNINKKAFLIENRSDQFNNNNYLQIQLKGTGLNVGAYGAQVKIYYNNQIQKHYHSPYRGYLSTMENLIHFGLGKTQSVDSLVINWPDQTRQVLNKVSINGKMVITQSTDLKVRKPREINNSTLFKEIQLAGLDYQHQENNQNDFAVQPLLMMMNSQKGPAFELSERKLDKQYIFTGSAAGHNSVIYTIREGEIESFELKESNKSEDVAAAWFDCNGDGNDDLFVVSGGGAFKEQNSNYQNRLYINENDGFKLEEGLPLLFNESAISASDFDHDGDVDLFLGGGSVPGKYPEEEKSYLLINEEGKLVKKDLPLFNDLGIISDAIWDDFDNDGWEDLIVVGEWMPVTIFKNESGTLKKFQTKPGIAEKLGWWNEVKSVDLDMDGDQDYILGNIGSNTPFLASEKYPFRLYNYDFDNNGTKDPVFTQYLKDTLGIYKEFNYHPLIPLANQINSLKGKFRKHNKFSKAPFENVFEKEQLERAEKFELNYSYSTVLMNLGEGNFEFRELPVEAQYAPVYAIENIDLDGDGDQDLILGGNFRAAETMGGWYDASLGSVLINDGVGNFSFLPTNESGLVLTGDVKSIKALRLSKDKQAVLVISKDEKIKVYSVRRKPNE